LNARAQPSPAVLFHRELANYSTAAAILTDPAIRWGALAVKTERFSARSSGAHTSAQMIGQFIEIHDLPLEFSLLHSKLAIAM
jgi:hypothetical protein